MQRLQSVRGAAEEEEEEEEAADEVLLEEVPRAAAHLRGVAWYVLRRLRQVLAYLAPSCSR